MKANTLIGAGLLVLVAACAQQEEAAPVTVEPVYDKFGNLVSAPAAAPAVPARVDTDGDGVPDAPDAPDNTGPSPTPGPDPVAPAPPYQNQNQNTNRNTNQNQNRTQTGSGG